MEEKLLLDHLIDLKSWEKLQNSIAEATGFAIKTVDNCGTPIASSGNHCEFCSRVRNDKILCRHCRECNALVNLKSMFTKEPFLYSCHFSVVNMSIPIVFEGIYMGAVMAGQVRVQNADNQFPECIFQIEEPQLQKARESLNEYYQQIPIYKIEQLESVESLLSSLCSILKKEFAVEQITRDPEVQHCFKDKKPSYGSNSIIMQAIEYIYSAKSQTVSLSQAAQHCHVSVPYLSSLFKKEIGETYSSFVSRLKITRAKELLQCTDMTVMEISDCLGFCEPGYFIKTFKKYTNETPANYRNHFKNENSAGWLKNS